MCELYSEISVDEENNLMTISGVTDEVLSIDFSKDVDFTELIEALTKCIAKNQHISFSTPKTLDNQKSELVVNTVKDFFEKYNQIISENISSEGDESEKDSE